MRREPWAVRFLLASVFLSAAAVLAQATVLGKQVYDLTGRELDLGLLGLAEFAPAALLVLVTGTVADRYDRRTVTAVAFVGQAAVAGGLGWYASTSPTAVGPIFALVFVSGVTSAFAAPASRSLPADTVAGERLPWLMARFSGSWQAAIVVGPVVGGFLYDRDVSFPYLAAAALLLLSAVAVLLIHVRPAATPSLRVPVDVAAEALEEAAVEPVLGHGAARDAPPDAGVRDAVEGLRFIRHHPVLLGAISLDLFAVLFGGAVALLPAIATDRLGVDAVGLGWLRAAGGVGAGLVTVALAIRPVQRHIGRRLLFVVALFGVATLFLGITRSFVVALLAMAVLSGADAVSVFIRATLVPLVTPSDKRGRVLAVENVFIGASNELGAFESGVAGQLLGPAGAIVLGGVGTLAVAGGWWFLFPALRDVDEFPASTDRGGAPGPPAHGT
ncbi:MAG TPA: MFS transporter [Acidimicrobiales bacterium]|nr:MFS transporter [Acidimicrobiales bacterium]